MKTKKLNLKPISFFFTLLAFCLISYFWGNWNGSNNSKKINDKNIETLIDSVEIYKTKLDSFIVVDSLRKANTFSYVYSAMHKYNPDIKDETVELFLNITEKFNLDSTETLFNICISQILYESGAQQHYSSRHSRSGQLVVSSANAIGISQITPPTSYDYLTKSLNSDDYCDLLDLGCDDLSFLKDQKYNYSTKTKLVEWLSKEKNNLILWGYIIKQSLVKRNGNINYTLIAYNGGPGHLKSYISNNTNTNNHKYVRKIKLISQNLDA